MDNSTHPYVIDADAEGSSSETAVLLVGTAVEAGLDPATDVQRITRPSPGFRITEALAEALSGGLDDEDDDQQEQREPETPETPEPDLSGNKQSLAPEHDIHGQPSAVAYQDWDYQDLKSAVSTRGLDVENQQKDTLIAALVAADADMAETTE